MTDLDRLSGGPSVSVPELCRALATLEGIDVHLVARLTSDPTVSESDSNFQIHWTDGLSSSITRILDELADDEARDVRPATIIHLHGLWDPLMHHASREAYKRNLPTVYSIRGMLEPWALRHKRWKKRIGWWSYQRRDLSRAALLHGTSPMELASIKRAGLNTLPSVAIANGVSLPESLPPVASRMDNSQILGFLGRLHPIKGLPNLVEAWAQGAPSGWILKLAGPDCDGHKQVLEDLIHRLGVSDSIHLVDSLDQKGKWEFLSSVDCLILPSFSENFGMVVAEALAAGTPVAATTASPWEILEKNDAGWSVAPDVESISTFLDKLSSRTSEELKDMGSRGRQLVEQEFTWQAIAARFATEYKEIVARSMQ